MKPESSKMDNRHAAEAAAGDGQPAAARHKRDPSDVRTMKSGAGLHGDKPFSVTLEIDVMQWCLFIVAIATRFWQLDQPKAVVFDEIFYGRFASMYPKHTFYFDSQPPLGKMLVALAGHYAGFNDGFKFDRIGAEYPPSVPVWYLRLVPALSGSLLVLVTYQIMVELRLSKWTATMAAILIIFENSLLTQSRFLLMEAPLLFFTALAMLSYLKFTKYSNRAFSTKWWMWLISLGVMATCAISVKYVAVFSMFVLYGLVGRDFWNMLPHPKMTQGALLKHLAARVLCLWMIPCVLYLSVFYVHLSLLYKAGPHDDIMTSGFQASLEGGLASITKGQPLEVAYGSQVTLRHTYSRRPCWLHSHAHVYPVRYTDNRGSSHQQQVTCYSFKDVNNWWIVKDPARNSLMVDDPIRPVKHGDVVQLIHGMTSRVLNSHDVAAPVSPQHQEVSCYIDYNISFPTQNLWRVISGRQLPDWGFHQFEVVTDKIKDQDNTVWNVEEHRYTRTDDKEATERDLARTEMIPLQPLQLGFFTKFLELQFKMLTSGKESELEHRFSSHPAEWPVLENNIAYWYNAQSNAQVHLLGNLVTWLSGSSGVLVYVGLLAFYLLRQRRLCWDIEQDEWEKFRDIGCLLLAGFLANYVPYFLTDRTLFLYNYLPALYFKILLLAGLVEHIHGIILPVPFVQPVYQMIVLVWITSVFLAFCKFSVICYGVQKLSSQDIRSLQWRPTWDFIHNGVMKP